MKLTTIHNGPKQTISTSGEFGGLQMVSEQDTDRCVSKDVEPWKGVDCEIHHRWRGERNIPYKGVEISPYRRVFKPWGEAQKGKPKSGQYLLTVGLDHYRQNPPSEEYITRKRNGGEIKTNARKTTKKTEIFKKNTNQTDSSFMWVLEKNYNIFITPKKNDKKTEEWVLIEDFLFFVGERGNWFKVVLDVTL